MIKGIKNYLVFIYHADHTSLIYIVVIIECKMQHHTWKVYDMYIEYDLTKEQKMCT